jgi:hypothetical protein
LSEQDAKWITAEI